MTEKQGEAATRNAARHTPGPWEILGFGYIYSATGINIASTRGSLVLELNEMEANARLIAQAPKLLEACQCMAYWLELHPIKAMPPSQLVFAKAAIAKATGEAVNPD